jgi:ATP-dependent Lon protease
LAALNQGIYNVIIPFANQKDLADIPKQFKDKMNFILAENLDEVFAVAFDKNAKGLKKSSTGNPKKDGKKPKAPGVAA